MKADDTVAATLKRLRLFGLLARLDEVHHKPWLQEVIAIELEEKTRRSLAHRQHLAGIGAFKPISDYDWKWPRKVDRALIEELFTLGFVEEGANVVFLGPNGVGKTMLLRNIADRALAAGHHVVVRTASDLLADLIKQESSVARARRLNAYVRPHLMCIDEVGYLSYDARHADLLFEVVTRRYEKNRSIMLTTNKPFAEWPTTFPNAACVVTLVDRLMHKSEIVSIDGDSYRLREAEGRQRERAAARKLRKQQADAP